ncbi:uncharacterized protein LY79DRAFT_568725 [Colletotrichum navitas]|uniref:Uncharacterized protein n=1 Tax=Colletotrichum navitas TaxID=681940 RepID=A0AAD8PNE0_9PEZI|nr:uncharacterized protein LY79DRAFT_568725 [Colletotrichum navitas]KAK1573384.1 hypothetical protein LY79DRAFT_568725 [Colletotrichum navitas]
MSRWRQSSTRRKPQGQIRLHPNKKKRYETEKTTLSWAGPSSSQSESRCTPSGQAQCPGARVSYRSINAPAAIGMTERTPTNIIGVTRIAIEMRTLVIPLHCSRPEPSGPLSASPRWKGHCLLGRVLSQLLGHGPRLTLATWKTGNETAAGAPLPVLPSSNTSFIQVLDFSFLDKSTLGGPNGNPIMDDRRPGGFPARRWALSFVSIRSWSMPPATWERCSCHSLSGNQVSLGSAAA